MTGRTGYAAALVAAAAISAMLLAASGCSRGEAAETKAKGAFPKDGAAALVATEDAHRAVQPGELATVAGAVVVGRTGPGGEPFEVALRTAGEPTNLARRFGTRTLDLGARVERPGLVQYPCAACHVNGTIRAGVDRIADAHHDIQPVHPHETGATCTSCHAPEDVSLLALGSGERATLDHAYRLCAQCHSPQAIDWAAGAHGKRLDGWQGRRVVMGCAECHDPHRPALQSRVPFPPPQIQRRGARER
jgi:hypothetical protein